MACAKLGASGILSAEGNLSARHWRNKAKQGKKMVEEAKKGHKNENSYKKGQQNFASY